MDEVRVRKEYPDAHLVIEWRCGGCGKDYPSKKAAQVCCWYEPDLDYQR